MATLNGGEGNDSITGTNSNDTINGRGGDDVIYGRDGDDVIYAGDGSDRIYGEIGNDTIIAILGEGYFYGGVGDDLIFTDSNSDSDGYGNGDIRSVEIFVYGDDGDDQIYGKVREGAYYGGIGSDIIKGWAPYISGGDGGDLIALSSPGLEDYCIAIDGGSGYDTIDLSETMPFYTNGSGYIFYLDTKLLINFEKWILPSWQTTPLLISDVNIPDNGLLVLEGGDGP